ncbi:hypothetical protein PAAG_01225 [Paracoccidioides lutzii Pb01]|uniref:Uncharacterized protein n=1 Tax=Paracoccidioides lutzii (strain ATCC MYA-826 / Pb01) TaxID=502779 RepID=C1GRT0_PARBA|nr:hypothetical protein PAAG_01225 [Paracoccidioides lutzii Pb01]EEH38304.2 hypothetical protein PAAG_01225 [Paracoccidioides lutzii Pb01]
MHAKYLIILAFSSIAFAAPAMVDEAELTPVSPSPTTPDGGKEPEYPFYPADETPEHPRNPEEERTDGHPTYTIWRPPGLTGPYPGAPPEETAPPEVPVSAPPPEATPNSPTYPPPAEATPIDYPVPPPESNPPSTIPIHTPSFTLNISPNATSPGYVPPPQNPPVELSSSAPDLVDFSVAGLAGILVVMCLTFAL